MDENSKDPYATIDEEIRSEISDIIVDLMDWIEEVSPIMYSSSDIIARADDTLKKLDLEE